MLRTLTGLPTGWNGPLRTLNGAPITRNGMPTRPSVTVPPA